MRLKEKLSIKRDMSYQAGKVWERVEMENALNFSELHIDPVPFHLAEKNLLKVQRFFSMLRVNHMNLTTKGRLISVVGLKKLRKKPQRTLTAVGTPTSSRNRRSPARTVSLPLKRSPVSVKTVSHLWTNLTLASVDSPLSTFLVFGPDNQMER